ncbi:MAG: hypothetical protein IPK16_30315 [Anaerolineales bacterium]|nr:hypothetical protein [Anaerolineales bacterium]
MFARRPSKLVLKIILVLGFGLMCVNAVVKLIGLVSLVTRQGPFYEAFADFAVVSGKSRYVVTNQTLLMTTQFLVVVVGILALIAVVLLLVGKDTWGVRIGTLGLIFSLCIVNFLVFYFAQLYALVEALGQNVAT